MPSFFFGLDLFIYCRIGCRIVIYAGSTGGCIHEGTVIYNIFSSAITKHTTNLLLSLNLYITQCIYWSYNYRHYISPYHNRVTCVCYWS